MARAIVAAHPGNRARRLGGGNDERQAAKRRIELRDQASVPD